MSRKDSSRLLLPDLIAPYHPDKTQPVSMQLIARLAAQDPAVQLKIGVIEPVSAETTEEEEKTSA